MRVPHFSVLCAVITVGFCAPQDKTQFHEHIEDFCGLIIAESGLQIELLLKQYGESENFGTAANYLSTTNFRDVLREVESLPEFKAVIDYLEKAQIDINHIIQHINELVDHSEKVGMTPKRPKDGELNMNNFIRESINLFPKNKLAELFEQKQKEYPRFRDSMEKLKTEEWERLYQALWESQNFKKAESTLEENGLDVRLLIEEIKAIFGQN